MLKILQLKHRHHIKSVIESFDPASTTWIVSDLKSKFEIQSYLLEKQSYFVEAHVLRASDFWQSLFAKALPNKEIISYDFAAILLKSYLSDNFNTLNVNTNSSQAILKYIELLAPILLHPEGNSRTLDWFEENSESAENWKDWYLLARLGVNYFLDSGFVLSSWVPHLIQNEINLEKFWSRNIILDLGSEITRSEAEVFRAFSRFVDVTVVEPTPEWRSDFNYLLKAYDDLRWQTKDVQVLNEAILTSAKNKEDKSSTIVEKKIHVLRFSGMLAEVKQATAQVRQWLDVGMDLRKIAIIAPDIELYWPILNSYLLEEGIPFQKDISQKYSSLPTVSSWLASLRSVFLQVNTFELENSFYKTVASKKLRYEEFQSLFYNIYGREDLNRYEDIQKIYQPPQNSSSKISRDEFIQLAVQYWEHSIEDGALEAILKEILKRTPENYSLSMSEWVTYLETIVAQKEIKIQSGTKDGLIIVPLMSSHSLDVTHRIFMGLCEEQLKTSAKINIPQNDLLSISTQLGFFLENPEQNFREFELRWIAESFSVEDIYCFPVTDFTGRILTPTQFWLDRDILKSKHEGDIVKIPDHTVWDAWTFADTVSLSKYRGNNEQLADRFLQALKIDQGQEPLPLLKTQSQFHLSPTSIEDYLKCPFTFAAKKLFKLKDLPEVDLDADRRTKGSILHELFEILTEEPIEYERTNGDLEKILDKIYIDTKSKMGEVKIWNSLKSKYIKLAQRFLAFEKEWRSTFKSTSTVGREKDFTIYFDTKEGRFYSQLADNVKTENLFKIIGKIDRIDTDQKNNFIVIDYKSSVGNLSSFGNWFNKRELQLLFYMWVVEKSFLPDVQGNVIAAHYLAIKDLTRTKGFQDEEYAGVLFPSAGRKKMKGTSSDKKTLLEQFEVTLKECIGDIEAGLMQPKPFDEKICNTCEWRRLCRKAHQY